MRLGKEKRYQDMMAKHEKDDQIKYKKLQLNVAGIRDYGFDSYGNPITVKNNKPAPFDKEVVKIQYAMSKKQPPPTLNPYYEAAFEGKKASKVRENSFLPPVAPNQSKQQVSLTESQSENKIPIITKDVSKISLLPPNPTRGVKLGKNKKNTFDQFLSESARARSQQELPDIP
jgi:hypothetical protein